MSVQAWLAFVATSCIVLAMPGPTSFLILRYATQRARGTLPRVVAGAVLGDAAALTICNFGLGALLAASAGLLMLLKAAAAVYLIGLGLTVLFGRASASQASGQEQEQACGGRPFVGVFLVTAFNPKGIAFFCALLPQFVDGAEPVLPQLVLLQATFCALSLVSATSWALAGTLLRRTGGRLFRRATGLLLIGAGVAQATGRLA
ncbi:hypothetical protein ASF53_21770 [Methylobacterium sp. Leaf123]|uniref:LysE family translocator n=1 Tax=Methylobacterium sp. Leaf123 TaxID=1736264 RepID=UPI0006FD8754|nr:LysE family translocator [Methylobacterium sp. Leaf123]KQQ25317.1 hypothetical protein ASF53_21770 [Methylobacterium sp. Leaf123]